MKVYKSFGSKETRDAYICKSEITRDMLNSLHIPESITLQEAKEAFDILVENDVYIVVPVGSSKDRTKRRHTKFVSKLNFYKQVIKGRYR